MTPTSGEESEAASSLGSYAHRLRTTGGQAWLGGTAVAALVGVAITALATMWKIIDDRSELRQLERLGPIIASLDHDKLATAALQDVAHQLAVKVSNRNLTKTDWLTGLALVYFLTFGLLLVSGWVWASFTVPTMPIDALWIGVGSIAFAAVSAFAGRVSLEGQRASKMAAWAHTVFRQPEAQSS